MEINEIRSSAIITLFTISFACAIMYYHYCKKYKRQLPKTSTNELTSPEASTLEYVIKNSVNDITEFKHNYLGEDILGSIGNTPLIKIKSLSDATRCEIYGKCEFLNPGGSVKDRVALQILKEAIDSKKLKKGGMITEGSVGSTGISLAMVSKAMDIRCFIAMPDDAAMEKSETISALGADVTRVRPVSISHPGHFVHVARQEAANVESDASERYFADQFENLANFRAHYSGTGSEIYCQSLGQLDAFICAAGTGGTIAGVSSYLKDKNPNILCFLVDPQGSSLYNRVTRGVLYTKEEAEGKRLRHQIDTITEGIGINRLTSNFDRAKLDGAVQASDREAVEMANFLMKNDGLFLGSSSAVNCVGAVKLAKFLGPGHQIVTILCDSGTRHLSKFHNVGFLESQKLTPKAKGLEFLEENAVQLAFQRTKMSASKKKKIFK